MTFKTDYPGHDRKYQQLQRDGKVSWSDDIEDNDSKRAWFRSVIAANFAGSKPRVLFLGCGAGEFVIDAAKAGADAVGIDIAPTAIAIGRTEASAAGVQCEFLVGDVLRLPLLDESVDLAIDDHCLHCIIGNDRKEFLAEARRVLKPGGLLLIRTMCSLPEGDQFDRVSRCQVLNGVATRYFGTPEKICAEVSNSGFRIGSERLLPAGPKGTDLLELEARKT